MNHSLSINNLKQNEDPWLEKDRWLASDIGLKPDNTHSAYYLNFSNIKTHEVIEAIIRIANINCTGSEACNKSSSASKSITCDPPNLFGISHSISK